MNPNRSIIFLYTRLPDYFYQCLLHFSKGYPGRLLVICDDPDTNTNYRFEDTATVKIMLRSAISDLEGFIKDAAPDAIYITGWRNREYKNIARKYRDDIPVILGLDNPWTGRLRQRVLVALSMWMLKPYFSHVWVTGIHQYIYALRLGFPSTNIINGLYAANEERYLGEDFLERWRRKGLAYPRRLLFVGRLVGYKQPLELASAFVELQIEDPDRFGAWTLQLAGSGPLREKIGSLGHPNIFISGFIDPKDLPETYLASGVFCLPSIEEHWGVVVHEAALAGLPLLLSDTVFAGYSFLIPGHNGVRSKTGDGKDLKRALREIMSLSDAELTEMGARSRALAARVSRTTWSAELGSVLPHK